MKLIFVEQTNAKILIEKWMQVNGMILWQYDGLKTTYGGYIVENAMIGSMSSFTGENGCWYVLNTGCTTMLAEECKAEFGSSGNKAKY